MVLAYDGTQYHGWQWQKNALTIQAVVEEKIQVLTREQDTVIASGSDMSLSVTEVVFQADAIVRDGSLLNPTPEAASDYVLVGLAATCNLPSDSSCRLSGLEFSLVDTGGSAHNPRLWIAGVPGKFEGSEFFGGATKSGYLIS